MYIPKLIHIIFYLLQRVYRRIFKRDSAYFTVIRIVLSSFAIGVMLISACITPRNFEVTHAKVSIPNLPSSFENYKIVLIADIHLGSWNRKYSKLKPVIKLVNDQHPDLIAFSGDMVNNFAAEAEGWRPYFMKLKAKDGKYAILGNHDYGDYTEWKSNKERTENRLQIRQHIRSFGFRLLLNENVYLKKGNDSLKLVGVENWGKSVQSRYCDLNKAMGTSNSNAPAILMSHDPNEWEAEVLGKNIVLTMSGHTHAAQLGIKIGNRLFSPASFVFKYWSGLYKVGSQYIYVNRGIGYIGLPMSVGVRPEITVIELSRK
jgi:predicted MPP superfamily phosphohydrolase